MVACLLMLVTPVKQVGAQPAPPGRDASALIATAAAALESKLVEVRRDLHMNPELANHEQRTSGVVATRLRRLGLEVTTNVAGYGVVALLKGALLGPVVAVRADMDALPIHELCDVRYRSKVDGVMHACGHDVHTTIGLGTAEVLAGMRDRLKGTVKFIFQPAEEDWPDGTPAGAALMIKRGVLENPRPAAIFGLHVFARPVGEVSYEPSGRVEASLDDFAITIRGKLAHGAMEPQKGVDAIVIAAECVMALQTIHSRKVDPMQPISLAVGTIQGGKATNVMADAVTITGTLRTLDPGVRDAAKRQMREVLLGVTSAHGASFDLAFPAAFPMVLNDQVLLAASVRSLRKAVGAQKVMLDTPDLGSEDFAFYQEVIPGFYFNLGVFNTEKGVQSPIHTATFDVDERCLVVGVKAMSNLVVDFLERESGRR
jgi:amidohydrolase